MTTTESSKTRTLWQRLGDMEGVSAIVDDFVNAAVQNPRVNYSRDGRFPVDEEALEGAKLGAIAFISSATGGPLQYEGRGLTEIHRGMMITADEFDAITEDFRQALIRQKVESAVIDTAIAMIVETKSMVVETAH
jgi:hemoglobin